MALGDVAKPKKKKKLTKKGKGESNQSWPCYHNPPGKASEYCRSFASLGEESISLKNNRHHDVFSWIYMSRDI